MKIITITVDETQQAQTVYSPDLDRFFQIYSLAQPDIDQQTQDAQNKMLNAQNTLTQLQALTQTRQAAVQQVTP